MAEHRCLHEDKIEDHHSALFGNGRPGAIDRLTRVEVKLAAILWVSAAAAASSIALLVEKIGEKF